MINRCFKKQIEKTLILAYSLKGTKHVCYMTFETCLHSPKTYFFKENESENIEIYIAVYSMAYSFH